MKTRYKVKVDNSLEFSFNESDLNTIDLRETSKNKFHILKDHRSFQAETIESDFLNKTYTVKINSKSYTVQISNELDLLIEEMGLSLGTSQQINNIKAPMPGLILDVVVKAGDEVKEGDPMLVLEAMKMENTLTAPRDGKVKSVSVEKSQTVEKNQLLIEME